MFLGEQVPEILFDVFQVDIELSVTGSTLPVSRATAGKVVVIDTDLQDVAFEKLVVSGVRR